MYLRINQNHGWTEDTIVRNLELTINRRLLLTRVSVRWTDINRHTILMRWPDYRTAGVN